MKIYLDSQNFSEDGRLWWKLHFLRMSTVKEKTRDFGTFFSKLRRKFTSLLSKVGEENLKYKLGSAFVVAVFDFSFQIFTLSLYFHRKSYMYKRQKHKSRYSRFVVVGKLSYFLSRI